MTENELGTVAAKLLEALKSRAKPGENFAVTADGSVLCIQMDKAVPGGDGHAKTYMSASLFYMANFDVASVVYNALSIEIQKVIPHGLQ